MSRGVLVKSTSALLLCAIGFFLGHWESYPVRTILATAGGCRMATDIYEPRSGTPLGSVLLFHGLAANKRVMAYNAQEFAKLDLRVFVPDLPGHGRTPGPFSPERDDSCAEALLRDLAARKAILPERTLLAGHSMGGAIAARVAARVPVAGVIAISPAPMKPASGIPAEALLFPQPPLLPSNSLVLSAAWEPTAVRQVAEALVRDSRNLSSRYRIIPRTTHVSILFASSTFAEICQWCTRLLGTSPSTPAPRNFPALGCILGVAGLSLLASPFLREMLPQVDAPESASPPAYHFAVSLAALVGVVVVLALDSGWVPFHFMRIFQADYLAVFLFLTALPALAVVRRSLPPAHAFISRSVVSSAASALLLVLLFAAWFEVTFYEAWLTPERWLRFPVLLFCLLPWHLAEEIVLGPPPHSLSFLRLMNAHGLRLALWLSLFGAILVLHSGEILVVLLLPYLVLFSLLQRLACDLVRFRTQSSAAAAIFGAILLAAFALAIFPVA